MFSGHCVEPICDRSCPSFTESSFLLEVNGIAITNPVFRSDIKDIEKAKAFIEKAKSGTLVIEYNDTTVLSNLVTYCAICQHWFGSRLHVPVYSLKLSQHIDAIQKTWNTRGTDDKLEQVQIWVQKAKILIVSAIDYINFNDFQAQTLLGIIHDRKSEGLTTIIVSPEVDTLLGKGAIYNRMKLLLEGVSVKW